MLENAKVEVAGIIENGKKTLENEKIKIVEEAKKGDSISRHACHRKIDEQ